MTQLRCHVNYNEADSVLLPSPLWSQITRTFSKYHLLRIHPLPLCKLPCLTEILIILLASSCLAKIPHVLHSTQWLPGGAVSLCLPFCVLPFPQPGHEPLHLIPVRSPESPSISLDCPLKLPVFTISNFGALLKPGLDTFDISPAAASAPKHVPLLCTQIPPLSILKHHLSCSFGIIFRNLCNCIFNILSTLLVQDGR